MREDAPIKEWLRDRRFTLWLVGIAVPLMIGLCFWSTVRPDWPFWVACYIIGLPAGIAVVWVRFKGREFWARLEMRQRILLRCLFVLTIWSLVFLQSSNRSGRFLWATVITVVIVLFRAGYVLFSRLIYRIWPPIRTR